MKTLAPFFYMALMGLLVQCSKTEVPQNVPCPEPTAAEQELIKNNPGFEYCFSRAQCSPNMAEVQERLFGKWVRFQVYTSSTELHWEWRESVLKDTIEYTRDLLYKTSIRNICTVLSFEFTSRRMLITFSDHPDCVDTSFGQNNFWSYRFEGEHLIRYKCISDKENRSGASKFRKIEP